ncbi:MAG: hypothetical protein UU72_C0003G0002 [candidate division WWE3 bacterium GW2011_GWB1_41_6]|uniref:Uncharacterized protein n=1 Tax=candidate division WWE3 bacterium GW2011_GWB1_41_6 TaxID=1619112 RepID=A0A0G0Z5F5_UNCKA|nr:MAG: hypothetical protein UU72_C0003G0002 [candidate division WWE3 bacterium GW2011_GWB1_41_6]
MTISNPEVLDNLPEATSDEVREVSLEEVERALREMYDGGFFTRMRSAVEHSPFFVGSKKDSPVVQHWQKNYQNQCEELFYPYLNRMEKIPEKQ